MDSGVLLRHRHLRYALIALLLDTGHAMTVSEVAAELELRGIRVSGRPSKVISDALRWDVRNGRVHRCGRGLYTSGRIPRSTIWWMRRELEAALTPRVTDTDGDEQVPSPVL